MSEALAPVGAPPVDSHPACGKCGCLHRFTKGERGVEVTYDAACPCGCTASAETYDRGGVDVRTHFFGDECPGGHLDDPAATDDDEADASRPGDDSGASGVDSGGCVRGGWLDRLFRAGLSGLARHFRRELDGLRGWSGLDRDSTNRSGDADSVDTPGPKWWLRGVVTAYTASGRQAKCWRAT